MTFSDMSYPWVILQMRARNGTSTLYTAEWCGCILSVTYHVFTRVVSRCLPCGFLVSDIAIFVLKRDVKLQLTPCGFRLPSVL